MGDVHRLFDPLIQWQIQRLLAPAAGYSLDLDSTVFERYGRQQGSLKGHNPRKHGRPSHHPLLAVLAESHFVLHGWLHSGNCGPARGVVEFLQEALAHSAFRLRLPTEWDKLQVSAEKMSESEPSDDASSRIQGTVRTGAAQ